MIAFCGLCASQSLVFGISWWFIIYQFLVVLAVLTVIVTASIAQYRLVVSQQFILNDWMDMRATEKVDLRLIVTRFLVDLDILGYQYYVQHK